MSTLRLATASNVRAFQNLTNALSASNRKWENFIDGEALEDEIGRFRVWAGNLGALQKGHSSLDYRLRDSPVSNTNTLKLLKELETNITEAYAVVSGARLPYEEQATADATKDEDSDDGFFSEEESDEDSSSDEPRSELKFRFREIVDIIDNLYKLSVRIRTPGVRSRSLRASSYTQKDPDTGVDIFEMYAAQDLKHTQELLSHLRQPYAGDAQVEQDFLATRLGASITLRRRHFKYWKRHRDKLHAPTTADDVEEVDAVTHFEAPVVVPNADLETHPMAPVKLAPREAPSQKTGRTLLSGTEVTQLHQSLDDIVDTKSVTSYAVTVKDIHGKGVDLPPPPKTANNDKDFECPYCWIVCPARYGKGRAWRTHLLQDLQPYICTYPDCESPELLFRSRREWAEHEASHRRIWRCPEHPDAVFSSQSRLENHLRQTHFDNFPESQLETIAKVGEATTADMRVKCPICCAPADAEDLGGLQNHIANHLERIATFALPHSREDDLDGDSGIASRGSTMSQSLTGSLPAGSVHANDKQEENDQPALEPAQSDSGRVSDFHHYKSELETMLEHLDNPNNPYHEDTAHLVGKPPTIGLDDVPTLRLLYRSQRLLQTDQSYVPNDSYNRMISICYYDITRLKVDAIVNNAPADLKVAPFPGTLHHAVMEAGGSNLLQETMSKVKIYPGKVDLTLGHDLPSDWVIHAAGPTYIGSKGVSQFIVLGDCYHSALRTAANLGIKTIAFPCLASGGGGFPARVAARIALQAVRENLDAHPEARFERIVFCVKSALDEKAYMDFFPVFFPPTYGDLDMARKSNQSGNRAKLASQVLDARAHMQKANKELSNKFAPFISELEMDALYEIESALSSIRIYLLGPKELEKPLEDLSLFCSVLVTLCGSIIKMSERAKATEPTEEIRQEIWNETSRNMHTVHGFDLGRFLSYCWYFAKSLDEVLTQDKPEWDMTDVRPALESYRDKEKTQDIETTHDLPDEAMKIHHSMTSASNSRNSVQLHEIRSVATLYQSGEIKPKRTMAQPSVTFNQTVCYVREDITRLAVDVIVNPTDTSFLGMGTLDRLVFKKGGPELQEEVKKFGVCEKGDIKMTPGYLLPAKQIIHVIPPQVFNSDTKNALRNMYRGILHTATFIGAKSVAIPSIGTGTLNYPRRDCGSLAMEEVRRFLQSREDGGLEKIIFVVYSHTDESTYKSLLPIYFPPTEQEVSKQPEAEGLDTSKTFVSDLVANALSRSSSANDQPLEMSKRAIPELDPVSTEIDESSSTDDESGILPPIQANVSIVRDSKATGVWGPISESSCIVQVMDRRVSVYEKVESSDEIPLGSHPIMSLNVLPGSGWSRTGLDRVILSKVRRASAPLDDRVSVLFQFYNPSDADDLSYILEQVILGIAIDEERARSNEESDDDNGKGDFSLRSDARGNMYRSFGRQDEEEGNTGSSSVAGRKEDTANPTAPPNVWSALSKKQGKMKEGSAQSNSKERSTAELASGFAALMGQAMHQDQENSMSSIAAADISSAYSKKDGKMEEESGQSAAGGSSTAQQPSADTSQPLEPNTESSPTLQSQPQYQLPEEDNTAHLLVQILEHLLIDLNIRPKSYIGTSTFEIASALNTDIATITSLLWELEEQGKVHTTIDSDTWVISGEPGQIPVLGSAEMHSR